MTFINQCETIANYRFIWLAKEGVSVPHTLIGYPGDTEICNPLTLALAGVDVAPSRLVTKMTGLTGMRLNRAMLEAGFVKVDPPRGRWLHEEETANGPPERFDPTRRRTWSVPGLGHCMIYLRSAPSAETEQAAQAWFEAERARSAPPPNAYRGARGYAAERRRAIMARLERLNADQIMVRAWIARYVATLARPDGRRNPDKLTIMRQRAQAYGARIEATGRAALGMLDRPESASDRSSGDTDRSSVEA